MLLVGPTRAFDDLRVVEIPETRDGDATRVMVAECDMFIRAGKRSEKRCRSEAELSLTEEQDDKRGNFKLHEMWRKEHLRQWERLQTKENETRNM